jgi:hypothetical protein
MPKYEVSVQKKIDSVMVEIRKNFNAEQLHSLCFDADGSLVGFETKVEFTTAQLDSLKAITGVEFTKVGN